MDAMVFLKEVTSERGKSFSLKKPFGPFPRSISDKAWHYATAVELVQINGRINN